MKKRFYPRTFNRPRPRDPEIERLVAEMRRRRDLSIKRIAEVSGCSQNTVGNLDRGKTREPRHATMSRIWNSLGFEYRAVPIGGGDD